MSNGKRVTLTTYMAWLKFQLSWLLLIATFLDWIALKPKRIVVPILFTIGTLALFATEWLVTGSVELWIIGVIGFGLVLLIIEARCL